MDDPLSVLLGVLSMTWLERVCYAIAFAAVIDPFVPQVPPGLWWTPLRWARFALHFVAQNWDRLRRALAEAKEHRQ